VKAYRWAADRIGAEGIIAFVSNNSFLDRIAFDGVRHHLARDFDAVYALDLGGDVRKNPKLSGTTHNVFGIQVGVSINLFIKRKKRLDVAEIYYARVDEYWRKEQKYRFLDEHPLRSSLEWTRLYPDKRNGWLTEGVRADFETFTPLGDKDADNNAIFVRYGLGVSTNRDAWAYNFDETHLVKNIKRTINFYNGEVRRWLSTARDMNVDKFVVNDDKLISWSRDLKADLKRGRLAEFESAKVRDCLYRPFTRNKLFFDRILNEEVYAFPSFSPNGEKTPQNLLIGLSGLGHSKAFSCFATAGIGSLDLIEKTQFYPFYTYSEDAVSKSENITDWALDQFRSHYRDKSITKWDIFYYTYALLHHPEYRTRYTANLKRELPRIPYAPDFYAFAKAGKRLAELHVDYEKQEEYKGLERREKPGEKLNLRVEKMRLSKDKQTLLYNDFLTLTGIPKETYDYRLGNRSALEWVIDQYQVSTDKRSGITNDPNRDDDKEYILRLIGQVITVSLETVKIVNALPDLGLPKETAVPQDQAASMHE
jgi:predicted helicase